MKPSTKKVQYRNPKMYIKKSGDMSQRFALRSKQDLSDPVFDRVRAHGAGKMDRYYGSDYYANMYGALEMTSWACKYRPSEAIQALNDKGKIEKPPKGAEKTKVKKITHAEYKPYPTEYKEGYIKPSSFEVPDHHAGRPLKHTPIGELWRLT